MMARLNQFFGRLGLATLRLSPNRNAGGGGGGGGATTGTPMGLLLVITYPS